MKKRLIAFVSMLMALVLCFALAACDGSTLPGTDPVKPGPGTDPGKDPVKPDPDDDKASMTLKQALNSVDKLLSGEDGWKGSASYKLSSANTEALEDELEIEKRGQRFEVVSGEQSLIYDAQTGYAYEKKADGYYASHLIGGAVDYVRYLVGGQLTDELTAATFEYDKKTGAAHFELDLADKINNALAPLYDAYKYDKTINALLNAYCTQYLNMSFDEIYQYVVAFVNAYKAYTVNDILKALQAAGVDVIALLEQNGAEISPEMMELIGPRSIEDMIAGAYSYLMQMMENMTAEEGATEGSNGMQTLLDGLFEAVFVTEYSEDQVNEAFEGIQAIIEGVLSMKVKTTIDSYAKSIPAELYAVIQNGVKLKALKLEFNVVFNSDNRIAEIGAIATFKHDYEGEAKDFVVLSDNDYVAQAKIEIAEYTIGETEFGFGLADDGAEMYQELVNIVYSPDGKDICVYFERGSNEIVIDRIDIFVGNIAEDSQEQVLNNSSVVYNTVTSCFEFKGELISALWDEDTKAGATITAVAFYNGNEESCSVVTIVYMNDDPEQLSDLAQKVIEYVSAPDAPEIEIKPNTPSEGGEESTYAA